MERVFLIGVQPKGRSTLWTAKDSLQELGDLARSAGARVVYRAIQNQARPSHHYLGGGKLQELKSLANHHGVHTFICDDELTPTQQRNLENSLEGIKIIDRTALILDVFARRARTKEGRLQVELAQHEYLLPRLAGQWSHLERLGAGIGTRGPGESQLETDRRLVFNKIRTIKKQLQNVRNHRTLYQSRRTEQGASVISLVGYTNAGKSTLMNSLTGSRVVAENKLFTTLDPVTRKIYLPSMKQVLLTDTVGFIHKLPPSVVAAFRSTLEEIEHSSLIIHVVDITHPNAAEQAHVVDEFLTNLNLDAKPRLMVLNKIDAINPQSKDNQSLSNPQLTNQQGKEVFISALHKKGVKQLLARIDEII